MINKLTSLGHNEDFYLIYLDDMFVVQFKFCV